MKFKSPYININEIGIDIIKNNQVIRHFYYSDIDQITMQKGFMISNWKISMIVSSLLTILNSYWLIIIINNTNFRNTPDFTNRGGIILTILPIFLLVGSLYWLYQSLKKCTIIKIHTENKEETVSLVEFEKTKEITNLILFLSEKVKVLNNTNY